MPALLACAVHMAVSPPDLCSAVAASVGPSPVTYMQVYPTGQPPTSLFALPTAPSALDPCLT